MRWSLNILLHLFIVVSVLSTDILEPKDFASEDDFENYLDKWNEENQRKWTKDSNKELNNGCAFRVNGDLSHPQPVYLYNGSYVTPSGTTGIINVKHNENIYISCESKNILYRDTKLTVSTLNSSCINGTLVFEYDWLGGVANITEISCSANPKHEAKPTEETCFHNNTLIGYGYTIDNIFYPLYHTCFNSNRLEALYSIYELGPENAVHQTGVTRPGWSAGSFYPGVDADKYYTKTTQIVTISKQVGEELANTYITSTQYLARGHLTAKTDMILESAQRATFYFSNAAPQWQSINAGNWNWLEQNIRDHIGELNYHTRVITGTFGVSQLRDQEGQAHDLYLYYDENNNPQIPVPMYYYKAVYEPNMRLGTVFVTINNPYINESEAKSLEFCTDVCRNNPKFDWLSWKPDNINYGWGFCCDINEFRKTITHLPEEQALLARFTAMDDQPYEPPCTNKIK